MHVHTYYGVVPPPFLTPKEVSCACVDRGVFLDLRSGHLISLLQKSSALPLALSLERLGENKALVLLPVTNTSCPAQGPIYLPPHIHPIPLALSQRPAFGFTGQAVRLGYTDYLRDKAEKNALLVFRVLPGAEEKATICNMKIHAQVPGAKGGPRAGASSV